MFVHESVELATTDFSRARAGLANLIDSGAVRTLVEETMALADATLSNRQTDPTCGRWTAELLTTRDRGQHRSVVPIRCLSLQTDGRQRPELDADLFLTGRGPATSVQLAGSFRSALETVDRAAVAAVACSSAHNILAALGRGLTRPTASAAAGGGEEPSVVAPRSPGQHDPAPRRDAELKTTTMP